jgi:HEAT repeat protein
MKTLSGTTTRYARLACLTLILASTAHAVPMEVTKSWSVLQRGVGSKIVSQRLAAVRALGLIHEDPHAAELAEKALKDSNASVRAAAATALGQMHASGADADLKVALNDKRLPVVMAAAHALRLLNDPACYDVYYEVLTGERKDDSGMVAQEMQIIHDPKQLAEMGVDEGIGYVPFASIGWEAMQTIMKDRKSGTAAKAALISALSTDPDARVDSLLVKETQSSRWFLRVAALEAIAKRGNPARLPDIGGALSDSKTEVRDTAAAAIVHLNDVEEAPAAKESPLMADPAAAEIWREMTGENAPAN